MTYALIILLLGILIIVHELGHFLAARWDGMPVARFSIGFGPRLWSRKYKETEFVLRLFPIGGYVLPAIEDESEFIAIPLHKRLLYFIGGPAANVLFALPLFAVLNYGTHGGAPYQLVVAPLLQASSAIWQMSAGLLQIFSQADQLSGPVGIVMYGGSLVGITKWIEFTTLLSLNLAVVNMLPIPILDGGKILLHSLADLDPRVFRFQMPLALAGLVVIISVMVYATVMDVLKLMV